MSAIRRAILAEEPIYTSNCQGRVKGESVLIRALNSYLLLAGRRRFSRPPPPPAAPVYHPGYLLVIPIFPDPKSIGPRTGCTKPDWAGQVLAEPSAHGGNPRRQDFRFLGVLQSMLLCIACRPTPHPTPSLAKGFVCPIRRRCNAADKDSQPQESRQVKDSILAARSSPANHSVTSCVCARQVTQVPIDQLAAHLGLRDVDQVLGMG